MSSSSRADVLCMDDAERKAIRAHMYHTYMSEDERGSFLTRRIQHQTEGGEGMTDLCFIFVWVVVLVYVDHETRGAGGVRPVSAQFGP